MQADITSAQSQNASRSHAKMHEPYQPSQPHPAAYIKTLMMRP
jgi:hypothetical protein